ncbi:MAG: sugar O-acetyltransferase [Desulfovibrio sp.]|jgi:Acetyltransferase (isoleucine patch superfamily)
MNQKERMLAGLPYRPGHDGLRELYLNCRRLVYAYNNLHPDKIGERDDLIRRILGKCGERVAVEPPFYCDYGVHIEVGDNFFANFNCVILDVARVMIGKNVMFAPNVGIYAAGHPVHWQSRNSGYEYGREIRIGDNVWLGGNVIVNPGINIGNNVVVGSGSVVTRDIPDNMLAAGNPCRVLREITDQDRKYYFRNLEFDVEDY